MSYNACLDTDSVVQMASNQGYYDYCDWIDGLDGYEALDHLNEHGWNEPASAVADELERAMRDDPPDDDVASTARGLLEFIRAGDPDAVLVISNGVGGEAGGDDE